jgi:ATP adenylyltransferase
MQRIWSPWRFDYVSTAAKQTGCIFCSAVENASGDDSLIVYRGELNFILLNRYPYNNGHIMIAPYEHVANPADADASILEEMMRLSQRVIHAMRQVYHPDGFNLGMNLGRTAGAGVEQHYHLHIVPRWEGDTNFMATLADTRVIPEDFKTTLLKLAPYFPK